MTLSSTTYVESELFFTIDGFTNAPTTDASSFNIKSYDYNSNVIDAIDLDIYTSNMGAGGYKSMNLLPGIFTMAAGGAVCATADMEPTDT